MDVMSFYSFLDTALIMVFRVFLIKIFMTDHKMYNSPYIHFFISQIRLWKSLRLLAAIFFLYCVEKSLGNNTSSRQMELNDYIC